MYTFQKFPPLISLVSSVRRYKQCRENTSAARLELEDLSEGKIMRITRRVHGDGERKKLRDT